MAKKISYYRRKADRLMQEWGRKTYRKCMVCGRDICCLHHYFPKSKSSSLRYDEDNLIPICNPCHLQHHTGNPEIHNTINEIKGEDWLRRLRKKKENHIKINIGYYKDIIDDYKE